MVQEEWSLALLSSRNLSLAASNLPTKLELKGCPLSSTRIKKKEHLQSSLLEPSVAHFLISSAVNNLPLRSACDVRVAGDSADICTNLCSMPRRMQSSSSLSRPSILDMCSWLELDWLFIRKTCHRKTIIYATSPICHSPRYRRRQRCRIAKSGKRHAWRQ